MIGLLLAILVGVVLFALQDIIAVKKGWFLPPSASRSWYIYTTIFICFVISAILG